MSETIDSNMMMLLISGNPNNFHNIVLINKQFTMNTGYHLEELRNKHIDILFLQGTVENVFHSVLNDAKITTTTPG
jgi:hypothetical protein